MTSEYKGTTSPNRDEISLNEIIINLKKGVKFLLSKWLLILAFGVVGGVLGFLYAYSKKPIYIATTTFVLETGESGGGLGQYAGIASMVGIDINGGGGGLFQGDNILELYKSRTMIEKALLTRVDFNGQKEMLIDHYLMFNKIRELWNDSPKLKGFKFSDTVKHFRLQDSLLGLAVIDISKNYLRITKPDKKLSIIQVDVKAQDEFFAKKFNDIIVQNVNDFYVQTKTKKSIQNIQILQQKTDSVRSVMNGAIFSAAAISDATPNLNPTRQVQRIAPVQRSQFAAETNKAVLGELVKNLEMSKMALLKETPLIQVVDQPIFPLQFDKISRLFSAFLGALMGGIIIVLYLIVVNFLRSSQIER